MIAAVNYNGTAHVRRGTVVGGIVELSARTGRPLRTLLAEHAAHSADPGLQPGAGTSPPVSWRRPTAPAATCW